MKINILFAKIVNALRYAKVGLCAYIKRKPALRSVGKVKDWRTFR